MRTNSTTLRIVKKGLQIELIATCAFGLEAVVRQELEQLGYQPAVIQPGRLLFSADPLAVCRANIHLRSAERILLCLGRFHAEDFGELFDRVRALPWHEWIPPDGASLVNGKSIKSGLSSVPACQRIVKKAIVEELLSAHKVNELPESGVSYRAEVALLNDEATLTLDTTGAGLHKRGYRPLTGQAPLRETMAAALIQLSHWDSERPFIDPFCGTGTIVIEAALIGRNIAPGLYRPFAAEAWPQIESGQWARVREEAREAILPGLGERILGTDASERDLQMARRHAAEAGVAEDIHFQQRDFAELTSKREYGCVICNPPYGIRMGDEREVTELYRSFPIVLRRLPTWSHFIFTAHPQFEQIVGQKANRRRKLYNGRIECQYFQYHGPKPSSLAPKPVFQIDQPRAESDCETTSAPPKPAKVATPVFGGLDVTADRQANEFRNRLSKRARHLRRWPARGITCYRLYERDIPEVPLVVDRYEDRLHIAEFSRPHDRNPAQHADWLDLMRKTAAEVMSIHPSNVFVKFRDRQRGTSQYERRGSAGHELVVNEGGLKFRVNLSDYLDTGLFLDHRITRAMVRDESAGKRVLNLFGYTGSFTVYAADGGAQSTVTVDTSKTYLEWAEENLSLNGLAASRHRQVRADGMTYLGDLHPDNHFDLAVVDPPTFSNKKDLEHDWDIQKDHAELLTRLHRHMSPGGVVFFSTNFRRFKLADNELSAYEIHEISRQTVPEDFRNRRIHRCWRMMA